MSAFALGTTLSPAMAASNQHSSRILVAQNETSIAAVPYLWAAERDAEGKIHLTGYAPTAKIKRFITILSGAAPEDTTQIADGAPDGFSDAAATAITLLKQVTEGRVSYNGKVWSLIASVADAETKQRVLAAVAATETAKNWRVVVQVSDAAEAAEEASPVAVDDEIPVKEISPSVPETAELPAEILPKVVAEPSALESVEVITPAIEEQSAGTDAAPESADAAETEVSTATEAVIEAPEVTAEAPPTDVVKSEVADVEAEQVDIAPAETLPEVAPAVAAEEPAAPVDVAVEVPELKYLFNARKPLNGSISMFGVVPQASAKFYLSGIAGMASTDNLYVNDSAPAGFLADAAAGLRALQNLSEGKLSHEFSTWKLEGIARTAEQKVKLEQRIVNLSTAAVWVTEIGVTPPIEICRDHVEHLAEANAILFGSGSARLVTSSTAAIDQLAVFLGECPDAIVHVEGHTDADGSDEKNLALSVARAEAVIAELIARGVREERLYAVGYGESQPIASNETNDGKRRNRRIVFKVLDEDR